jgi:hypothetical protein
MHTQKTPLSPNPLSGLAAGRAGSAVLEHARRYRGLSRGPVRSVEGQVCGRQGRRL